MQTMKSVLAPVAVLLALAAVPVVRAAEQPDDRFIAGYAAAVLEREFSLRPEGLTVEDGHLRYPDRAFGTLEKQQLIKSLSAIEGVKDVTLYAQPHEVAKASTQPVSVAAAPGAKPVPIAPSNEEPLSFYLSPGRLFEPILADPRWPHFFASYNHYSQSHGVNLTDTASVGFGETISLARKTYQNGFRIEGGVQAGVFAIFDLDSDSFDLINADYFVGPYVAARLGDFSLLGRVFHQSSHLGDEFLLRGAAEQESRVNLSYEAIDLLASYELPYGFRVYGGGGWLFDTDPGDLKPWMIQYGAEWRSPQTILAGSMRPIAAVDMQNHEDNNWSLNYSIRAGVQFEDPNRFSQRMQLMLEFYDGHSPNGQFYIDRIVYYGVGLHFYF